MLKLIGAALALWIASAVLRAYRDIQRAREINRIRHEASVQATEQALIREEQERQRIAAQEYVRRQVAIEREQIRLARESAQHTATLANHEKRISNLEFKVRKLDRDISAQKALLGDYCGQLDWFIQQQEKAAVGSKEYANWQNKIVTKSNQVRKANNKLDDLLDAKECAERELATA